MTNIYNDLRINVMPRGFGYCKDTLKLYCILYIVIAKQEVYCYATADDFDYDRFEIIDFKLEFFKDMDEEVPFKLNYNKILFKEIEEICMDMFYTIQQDHMVG